MSEVDLYAVEAKFNNTKAEYISLMDTLQQTCLGKEKSSKKCQKAAELNADMQTYLIQMSNLMKKTDMNLPKQQELLNVSNQLDVDMNGLLSSASQNIDMEVFSGMNQVNAMTWTLCAITVFSVIVYQWQK
jgi:hypothetical protein